MASTSTEENEIHPSGLAAAARKIMKGLHGLDTSKVEVVDEEQAPPTVEADSVQEDELMIELEKILVAKAAEADSSNKRPPEDSIEHACLNASKEEKLMCLRGRKYSPERAAKLLPQMLQVKKDYDIDNTAENADTERLKLDVATHKMCYTGGKDSFNRGVVWLRFAFHNPAESNARDLCRLAATVMLDALKDPDVQRYGILIIQDMTDLKLSNIDVSAIKQVFGTVIPHLPVRVGRICVFNPPWIVGKVLLPVVMTFMSRKLKNRIVIIKGEEPENLLEHIPATALPKELGGQLEFDAQAWADGIIGKL